MKYVRSIALLFSISIFSFALNAEESSDLKDPAWVQKAFQPIVYSLAGMEKVEVRKNIVYKAVDGVDLEMDIYIPPNTTNESSPIVLYVHGGPVPANLKTKPKDWESFISHGRVAAASGFVGAVLNRRFFSYGDYPASQSDIESAIKYLRDNAKQYNADKDKIVVWTVSGGGVMLGPLAAAPQDYIKGLIGYYTLLDVRGLNKLVESGLTEQQLENFSLAHLIADETRAIPPLFIASAGLEGSPQIKASIEETTLQALKTNREITVMNHPEGQHGFDFLDDNQRSREIIAQTLAFIKVHTQ